MEREPIHKDINFHPENIEQSINNPEINNPDEQPPEQSTELNQNKEIQPDNNEVQPDSRDSHPRMALSNEQKKEIADVETQTRAGLGALWETLPRNGKLKKDKVLTIIDDIAQLRVAGLAVKKSMSELIHHHKLNEKDKDDFINELLENETVNLWMFSHGLGNATTKHLAKVRESIRNDGK